MKMELKMNINKIPLIYFIPTVVMIDDNRNFLDNFSTEINYDGILEKYTNPIQAINKILSRNTLFSKFNNYIRELNAEEIDDTAENNYRMLDYESLVEIAYNEQRLQETAVVIVDYSMPEMNGIEFFERIKDHPCMKIMLTGEADNALAIDAFNNGLIDKFILKDVTSMASLVKQAIHDLIRKYFIKFSTHLWHESLNITSQIEYIDAFSLWLNQCGIVEYYAISNSGSKIGMDKNGARSGFLVSSEDELKEYVEVASQYQVAEKFLPALKSRASHLVFFNETSKKEPVDQWGKYLVDIEGTILFSGKLFYYSKVCHLSSQLCPIERRIDKVE